MSPERWASSGYERLTGADRTNLMSERPGVPWHVGLVGVLDGAPLIAADGSLAVDRVADALRQALWREPRLRQVIRRTRPLQGPPVWVDAAAVPIEQHLRVEPVPPPGDEPAFLDTCERVLAPPMDRSRPLWDVTLLPGLVGGRVGLVVRLHHAVADGVAALRILAALLDGPPATTTARPTPAPSGAQLAADAWRVRRRSLRASVRRRPDWHHATSTVRALRGQLAELRHPAQPFPRTSLTRPLSANRQLAVLRLPLAAVRAAASTHGGSVNDAVLAAVAGGLHAVLASRGEPADVPVRASVPVSLRVAGAAEGDPLGNRVGVLLVALPLDEPDPGRRVARIAATTREEKVRARQAGALVVMSTTLGVRLALPLLRRQRLVSVFVTNVPGPATRLSLAGAELLEAYPAAPIAGNVTLGVGVLSYAGDLSLGLVTDADAWPDLPVFRNALQESFDALCGQAAASPD
jgi:diacylglycerol O-acyltransferase / wax synthase